MAASRKCELRDSLHKTWTVDVTPSQWNVQIPWVFICFHVANMFKWPCFTRFRCSISEAWHKQQTLYSIILYYIIHPFVRCTHFHSQATDCFPEHLPPGRSNSPEFSSDQMVLASSLKQMNLPWGQFSPGLAPNGITPPKNAIWMQHRMRIYLDFVVSIWASIVDYLEIYCGTLENLLWISSLVPETRVDLIGPILFLAS